MSKSALSPSNGIAKTKIVATIGPACSTEDQLLALIEAAVDVFRLNMAHDRGEADARLAAIRNASRRAGRPVAVLADLAGPKIRLGELPNGEIICDAGAELRFVRGEKSTKLDELTATYEPLVDELAVDDRILLADGTVSLVVTEKAKDHVVCRVVQPGRIRSRQGVNLPGVRLSVPAMSDVDRQHAIWAAKAGVDFVGLSFVRRADDIRDLKTLLASHQAHAQVIAKIEKPEALDHLEEIVQATDGIMVARGDLGVETDIARVALAQKQIVAMCHRYRKPVIVATQMLDSMQHSRLPTRAEVTDVANAILDGADACMLSGETAVGEYPREAVEMMNRIALATESLDGPCLPLDQAAKRDAVNPITEATVRAAGQIARDTQARLIVVFSASGATALALAKNRNGVPVVGVSDCEATLRRMCLYWGVVPLPGAPAGNQAELLEYVVGWGRKEWSLVSGDRIVLIAGTGLAPSAHNSIAVHQIA